MRLYHKQVLSWRNEMRGKMVGAFILGVLVASIIFTALHL